MNNLKVEVMKIIFKEKFDSPFSIRKQIQICVSEYINEQMAGYKIVKHKSLNYKKATYTGIQREIKDR